MGKEPQMMRCLVNCHFDRMQCQKSLACVTFDTPDTAHIKILADASSLTLVCAIRGTRNDILTKHLDVCL